MNTNIKCFIFLFNFHMAVTGHLVTVYKFQRNNVACQVTDLDAVQLRSVIECGNICREDKLGMCGGRFSWDPQKKRCRLHSTQFGTVDTSWLYSMRASGKHNNRKERGLDH